MLQSEFTKLTGIDVTPEEYTEIEYIYNACGDNINKQTFCCMFKTKGGLTDLAIKAAKNYNKLLCIYNDLKVENANLKNEYVLFLLKCINNKMTGEDIKTYKNIIKTLLIEKDIIKLKISNNMALNEEELKYIKNNL